MAGPIQQRLQELGIVLPPPAPPAASYAPYVRVENILYVAGQIPLQDGKPLFKGIVGHTIRLEEAVQAARLCALNILSQANAACAGDLDRVVRCVKLGGFVASTADFVDHSKVMNGASELMIQIFGPQGQHVRFAVGASSLPLGVCVEVEAIFEIGPV